MTFVSHNPSAKRARFTHVRVQAIAAQVGNFEAAIDRMARLQQLAEKLEAKLFLRG